MMQSPEHAPQLASMLVELDAIYDTRAATLARISKEKYLQVLVQDYFVRKSDHFDGVDSQQFFQLYRERDSVTLSMAMTTHVVSLLKDFVARVNIAAVSAPIKKVPNIDINIYPYKLTDKQADLICMGLRAAIADRCEVNWVNYSPEDLHYDLLKHTYDHAVMYSIGPLLEAQSQDWEKRNKGIPDLTVFTPLLCHSKDKTEVPSDMVATAMEVEKAISPILNLMQVPVQFFCTVLDPRMFKPDDTPEGVPPDKKEVS